MCYQGNCVDSAMRLNNSNVANLCDHNTCQNGGICDQNSTTGSLFCKCQPNLTYSGIEIGLIKYKFLHVLFFLDLLCSKYLFYRVLKDLTTEIKRNE